MLLVGYGTDNGVDYWKARAVGVLARAESPPAGEEQLGRFLGRGRLHPSEARRAQGRRVRHQGSAARMLFSGAEALRVAHL